MDEEVPGSEIRFTSLVGDYNEGCGLDHTVGWGHSRSKKRFVPSVLEVTDSTTLRERELLDLRTRRVHRRGRPRFDYIKGYRVP